MSFGRGNQTSFGPPITPKVVKTLLIANGAVFVAQNFVPIVSDLGTVSPAATWEGFQLWRPFSYMWLHAGVMHLAFNMLALWMFGSQLALAWGPKRFLRFYLICGVGAGLIIATYPYLMMTINPTGLIAHTLGASGAVYGVLLAYSLTWPDRTIMLIFPPIAFRAIWLIPGLFFMSVAFDGGKNISHIGHLGGVIVAWIYLRRSGQVGSVLSINQLRLRWKRYRMRRKLRAVRYEEFEAKRRDNERKYH